MELLQGGAEARVDLGVGEAARGEDPAQVGEDVVHCARGGLCVSAVESYTLSS